MSGSIGLNGGKIFISSIAEIGAKKKKITNAIETLKGNQVDIKQF